MLSDTAIAPFVMGSAAVEDESRGDVGLVDEEPIQSFPVRVQVRVVGLVYVRGCKNAKVVELTVIFPFDDVEYSASYWANCGGASSAEAKSPSRWLCSSSGKM